MSPNSQEDCLFMKVIIPETGSRLNQQFPVLLWPHGGGFNVGSNNYNHDAQCDVFIANGVRQEHLPYTVDLNCHLTNRE